ncbi:MAG: PEP-CTERM sorting domain-containing protein [Planctomycetia bacterium]|nr:PEP-CTERM sorting domain-containing protein [Planctomycetia bacterium]
MRRTCVLSVLFFMLVSVFVFLSDVHAATQLSGLMRGDVTDPTDSIKMTDNISWISVDQWKSYYTSATWTSISSKHEGPFADKECPSNVFNNVVGGGSAKWFDPGIPSTSNPAYVTVQFPEAFVMTHFTLTSANDSWAHDRQPDIWTVYGSNDGENWNTIYHANSTADFTQEDNKTVLYSSFTNDSISSTVLNAEQQAAVNNSLNGVTISAPDFSNNSAYSWYKLEVTQTAGIKGAHNGVQVGEWEIYGNTANKPITKGNGLSSAKLSGMVSKLDGIVYNLDAQNTGSITTDADGNITKWADTNNRGIVFENNVSATSTPNLVDITIGDQTFKAADFTRYGRSDEHPSGGDFMLANQSIKAQSVFILAHNDAGAGNLMGIWGEYDDYGIRYNNTNKIWQGSLSNANNGDFGSAHNGGGTFTYNGTDVKDFTGGIAEKTVLTSVTLNNKVETIKQNAIGTYFSVSKATDHGPRAYDGQIMEVMVFDRDLTDWETRLVNTMFATKYGMDIANTLVFPTTADGIANTYNKEILGVLNKGNIVLSTSGDGGLAISGAPQSVVTADSGMTAFDIFGNYVPITAGTEIYAVSNTDSWFGMESAAGIKFSEYDVWAKEWYITNFSETAEAWDMMLTFNEANALFNGERVADNLEWSLLYRDSVDGEYSMVANLNPEKFANGVLSFTMSSDLLQTGFYTLGIQTTPEAPEPATWVLLLFGAGTLLVVKRRNSSRS